MLAPNQRGKLAARWVLLVSVIILGIIAIIGSGGKRSRVVASSGGQVSSPLESVHYLHRFDEGDLNTGFGHNGKFVAFYLHGLTKGYSGTDGAPLICQSSQGRVFRLYARDVSRIYIREDDQRLVKLGKGYPYSVFIDISGLYYYRWNKWNSYYCKKVCISTRNENIGDAREVYEAWKKLLNL